MAHHDDHRDVLLALSGGVDSAVAALLLQRGGWRVRAVFFKMWSEPSSDAPDCGWRAERRDAYAVAARLRIPIVTVDCEREYRRDVMEAFYRAYADGRTPNPDLRCNSAVKFPTLLAAADRLGIRQVATGHYARIAVGGDGTRRLLAAADAEKDQTYFLARLAARTLERVTFPVGDLTKREVRAIAKEAGLPVAEKRSTRGICFVGKVDLPDFLRARIPDAPGEIVTASGQRVGAHRGTHAFTIGQRQGIAIGGGDPYFVMRKDAGSNALVVTREEKDLLAEEAEIADVHWIGGTPSPDAPMLARARYRSTLIPVRLTGPRVRFATPERALTPGQEIVFYQDGACLGAGEIISVGIRP